MRTKCLVTAVAIFAFFCSIVSGDCLLRRVATDGAWATFHWTEKWDDGIESGAYITIKFVGSTLIDSQPARWIELKLQGDDGRANGKGTLFKFLVLEKHLGLDGDPLRNVLKAWRKRRDDNPTENLESDLPRLSLFISAPIKNLKKTDQQRTVEWQGGRLTCDIFEGSGRYEHKSGNDTTRYLLGMHEKIPFGVAAATLKVTTDNGDNGTFDFRVIDFGTNAISDLPDLK